MLTEKQYSLATKLTLLKWNIKDKIQDILKLEPTIKVTVEAKVITKDKKIIKIHKQHSHSFVQNYLGQLATMFSGVSYYYVMRNNSGNYYTIGGTGQSLDIDMDINDGSNSSSYGIVVGTGTTPPTPNDYNLGNLIENGTSTNTLSYGSTAFIPNGLTSTLSPTSTSPSSGFVTINGNISSIQIQRTFTNNSGATITITETGIVAIIAGPGPTNYSTLIIHDLLSSAISIPNGSTLTITYTISVST